MEPWAFWNTGCPSPNKNILSSGRRSDPDQIQCARMCDFTLWCVTIYCDLIIWLKTFVFLYVGSIQAAWRGYIVRCWFHKLQQTSPPKDPNLRRKFYQEKVHVTSVQFFQRIDTISWATERASGMCKVLIQQYQKLTFGDWEQFRKSRLVFPSPTTNSFTICHISTSPICPISPPFCCLSHLLYQEMVDFTYPFHVFKENWQKR